MTDQEIVQNDNWRAKQVENQQMQIREKQRQILRDENLQLMANKRNQEEFVRSQELIKAGTSPGQIGEGYQQQLRAMQEKERVKQMQINQYANNVGSPARQKQLQTEQDSIAQVQNSQSLLNQRAQMA